MITAVAVVLAQQDGTIVKGQMAKLESDDGMQLLVVVSNEQGYDVFKRVPLPFDGQLKIAGAKDPQGLAYVRDVHIPDGATNVTIRVGPSPANPQDVQLDGCVPFV